MAYTDPIIATVVSIRTDSQMAYCVDIGTFECYICMYMYTFMYLDDKHIQQQWRQTGRFLFATFLIPSTFGYVRTRR